MAIEGQFAEERNGQAEELAKLQREAGADPGAPEDKGKGKPQEDWDEAFAKVQADLEMQRTEAQKAAERARQAEGEAARLRGEVHHSQVTAHQAQLAMVDRALQAEVAAIEGAKRDYAAAMQEGDYARAADAQAAMAEAAARKASIGAHKANLEARGEPAAPQAPPAAPDDSFEGKLARYTPRTQAFIRQHPEVLTDERTRLKAEGLHSMALSEGYVPDTDAYFHYMEQNLGGKPADKGANPGRTGFAAPPARRGMMGAGRASDSMTVADMTPKMMQLAQESDMKPEEWLREYQSLVASGQMTPLS